MPTNSHPHRLTSGAVFMALVSAALWGGNTVAVKYAVEDISPIACAGWRFLLSLPIIAIFAWFEGISLWPGRSSLVPILINTLFLLVQIASFNIGTSMTQAGRASVLINIHPFVVAPLAWWFLGERLRWYGLVGILLAAVGIGWLSHERLPGLEDASTGDAILAASAILLGVQSIYQKASLTRVRGTVLLFWQTLLSVPCFFIISALCEDRHGLPQQVNAWLGLAYQGVAVSGLCFIMWFMLLRRYPVSQVASIGFLVPIFGVASGMIFLNEQLTFTLAGSTALVGLGIYLVTQGRVPPSPTTAIARRTVIQQESDITEFP
jgi:drug/metabolite transporter (DMT)-like permease